MGAARASSLQLRLLEAGFWSAKSMVLVCSAAHVHGAWPGAFSFSICSPSLVRRVCVVKLVRTVCPAGLVRLSQTNQEPLAGQTSQKGVTCQTKQGGLTGLTI